MQITGSQLIINSLIEEGVDKIFAYPGGYDKDIFDALYHEKDIELILPRHEQGLIHAAEGYAAGRTERPAGHKGYPVPFCGLWWKEQPDAFLRRGAEGNRTAELCHL